MGEWVFGWEEFGEVKMNIKELLKVGIEKGTFPNRVYKFREFNEFTYKIILDSELYFASPKKFNDPFDCNLSYREEYSIDEIDEVYKNLENTKYTKEQLHSMYGSTSDKFVKSFMKLNEQLISSSGILSLSKSNNNITMWSHYARNHTGLVFELHVNEDFDFFTGYSIVNYRKDYEKLSYTKDDETELYNSFITKYTDWKYEEEIRIIDFYKNGAKKKKKNVLKTIYFGYKSDETNIKKIIQLCQLNGFKHVQFKKAKLIPGKFALDFDEIDKSQYL